MSAWQLTPAYETDDLLLDHIGQVFAEIYQENFAHEPFVNHQLPIEIRGLRQHAPWSIFLLLTPWMLSRCFIAQTDPKVEIPKEWEAQTREKSPYVVIGPGIQLPALGRERTHLNYHPRLGHYLIQPLAQSMVAFQSAEDVFSQWNGVIKTRQENIEKLKAHCPWQEEVSRRELFSGLLKKFQK